MKIEKNRVVELIYTLTLDGVVADSTTEERPLDFIFGTGMLLPKFEEYILGLEPGAEFKFTLSPEEGYGKSNPEMIIELEKSIFEVEGKVQEGLLTVGNVIPMMNQYGGVIPGKVAEVKETTIMMDFNHQMADKTLNFEGKILTVREATETELKEGLHGEFKQAAEGGCNCDSGSCSSCGGGCGGC